MFSSIILQLIVVISSDWGDFHGVLYRFERNEPWDPWTRIGNGIPIGLGDKGMALGMQVLTEGVFKKEGDFCSPCGIFPLGSVFGDEEHRKYAAHMPYLLIERNLECIDDPKSIYYNQLVHTDTILNPDWTSSEKCFELLDYYKIGVQVLYNTYPIDAGAGSCIFMHVWRNDASPTAGCTAMAEGDLQELVSWMDSKKRPLLVQMPIQEYLKKQGEWLLPEVENFK